MKKEKLFSNADEFITEVMERPENNIPLEHPDIEHAKFVDKILKDIGNY